MAIRPRHFLRHVKQQAAVRLLAGDKMVDWAAAKVPFLQKEIPAASE